MLPPHWLQYQAYIQTHYRTFIDGLLPLLSQPSISHERAAVRRCAVLLRDLLQQEGVDAEVMETHGNPVVYGEIAGEREVVVRIRMRFGHRRVHAAERLVGQTLVQTREIRRAEPALNDGSFTWLSSDPGVLAFERGRGLICITNLSGAAIPLPRHEAVLLASADVRVRIQDVANACKVTVTGITITPQGDNAVKVKVDGQFNWIFPGVFNLFGAGFTNPMNLHGNAVMRLEGSS